MLGIDIILIPILAGFLFIKYCNLTRFRAVRDNGYVILFKAAIIGLFFFGVACFFGILIIYRGSEATAKFLTFLEEYEINHLLIPALFSVALIGVVGLMGNNTRIWSIDKMKRKVIREDDDAFEVMLMNSFDKEQDVQITLETNKVYLGKVTDTYFRVKDEIKSIQLNPIISGYRNEQTQSLTLDTYYGTVYEDIAENPGEYNVKISDFSVSIIFDRIVSISPFDFETYTRFQEEVDSEERSIIREE